MVKTMDDKKRGLYRRYRVDRLDDVLGKHNDCLFFVLDLDHDPHAIPAIIAYIESCEADYPVLAADLAIQVLKRLPKGSLER